LAEIEFWRERLAVLSSLSEQLNLPVVKKILDVMTHADSFIMQELEKTTSELRKYHEESSSNVQFLTTMERHFRVRSDHSYVAFLHRNRSRNRNTFIYYFSSFTVKISMRVSKIQFWESVFSVFK